MIGLISSRCCGCGKVTAKDDAVFVYKRSCICRSCSGALRRVDGSRRFFGSYYNDHTFSPFYYDGLFRKIFLSFKFHGNRAFGHILGMAVGDELKDIDELRGCDAIVPVPLSRERLNERGYNQSLIMAEHISGAIGAPVDELLKRIKNTPVQSVSVGTERTTNLHGAFFAAPEAEGKKLILFDDIHTTGSTLNECMRTLKNAGAADVCYVTAAYVYHEMKNNTY